MHAAASALVDAEDGTGPGEPPDIPQFAVFCTETGRCM